MSINIVKRYVKFKYQKNFYETRLIESRIPNLPFYKAEHKIFNVINKIQKIIKKN